MEKNNNDLFDTNFMDLGDNIGAGLDDFSAFFGSNADEAFGNQFQTPAGDDIKKDSDVPPTDAETNGESEKQAEAKGTDTEVKTDEKDTGKADEPIVSDDDNKPETEGEAPDFFSQAIAAAETKQAEDAKSSLADKPPIFVYGNAKDEIVDISMTFDALRVEKAEDFPELDDATSVSWKMTYGTINKQVTNPKKSTILSLKKEIETSKDFVTMLKKAKGDVSCNVTPSVTAKKKGIATYKGAFLSMRDAALSGKAIVFVPSDDGNVYEVRSNAIGTFVAKADNVSILNRVRAGFTPALPQIPHKILMQIISFFKSFVSYKSELEALAYIYWSADDKSYYVYIPKQQVSKLSVDSTLPELDESKFTLVMEIHSHNTMRAEFSPTDNKDERATRLYAVIGRLDKFFPDIKVRFCVGGKFVEIDPNEIFEGIDYEYPNNWIEAVKGDKML